MMEGKQVQELEGLNDLELLKEEDKIWITYLQELDSYGSKIPY